MTDYLWQAGSLKPIGIHFATGDFTLRRSVSCKLGEAIIYHSYAELPYNYVVEIMQDRVWISDLNALLDFAELIGMQISIESQIKEVLYALRHETDLLDLLALLRSKEENAE